MSAFSRRSHSLLCATILAGVSTGALAQNVIELDTVVVETQGETQAGVPAGSAAAEALAGTGAVDGYVAAQSTTGSKSTTPVIETPQSISVVTSDQLEDRAVNNLGQAVAYSAGIVGEPFGNDVRFFNPLIRGFDAVDSVYLNSFRFIRDFGALAFEPYGLERVEILRGPASVLYGQGEPGGIVNLVAKRPTFTDFGEVFGRIGNNSRYETGFDVGGVDDTVSYRMTGVGRLLDGEQDFTSGDRLYLAPSLIWAPDADTSVTVLGSLQYDTGTSQIGLPRSGTLDDNPNGIIPRSRYLGEPGFNDNESLLGTLGYEFRHRFNEQLEFRQNAQYLAFDADTNNLYNFGTLTDDRLIGRGVNVQSERIDSFGFDNQLEATFQTGALAHTAVVGLDYRNSDQFRSSNFSGSVSPIDVFDPVYGSPVTVNPDGANRTDTRIEQVGLYVQDQVAFDRLTVTLGARQDWTGTDEVIGGLGRDDDGLSGRIGAVYLFDNGLAPYASYATSFNPQSGTDTVSGEPFGPTEGEQWEAGVKFQPTGWNSFITASIYDLTKTNIAVSELDQTGAGVITSLVGEQRSRGFELEATASLAEGLDLVGNYTYTDAEITQGNTSVAGVTTTGNRPANIPEHSAALWLGYAFQANTALEGVSLGAGIRYVGSRFGDVANSIELPSNTLVDAAIRFEKNDFEAALNVKNITDERYVASCNFGCFYGEGRSVIGTVSYKW